MLFYGTTYFLKTKMRLKYIVLYSPLRSTSKILEEKYDNLTLNLSDDTRHIKKHILYIDPIAVMNSNKSFGSNIRRI